MYKNKVIHIIHINLKAKKILKIIKICIVSSISSNRPESQNQAQYLKENLVDIQNDTDKQKGSIAKENIEN